VEKLTYVSTAACGSTETESEAECPRVAELYSNSLEKTVAYVSVCTGTITSAETCTALKLHASKLML
jgi:hypothetical protein